jgi:predicted transcriptional regulator
MIERLAELEEAELATNIAIGEQQFEQGEFVPLKDAIAELETRWQQRSAQ